MSVTTAVIKPGRSRRFVLRALGWIQVEKRKAAVALARVDRFVPTDSRSRRNGIAWAPWMALLMHDALLRDKSQRVEADPNASRADRN
jgi:hypothetical protein